MIKKTLLLIFASISLMAAPPPTNNNNQQSTNPYIDYLSHKFSMCGTGPDEKFQKLSFEAETQMMPYYAVYFKGFYCPPLAGAEIMNTYLTSINLETGEYTCGYATESSSLKETAKEMTEEEMRASGFKEVNYVNPRCELELHGTRINSNYSGPFWFKTKSGNSTTQIPEQYRLYSWLSIFQSDTYATYPTGKITPTKEIEHKDSLGAEYKSQYIGTEPIATTLITSWYKFNDTLKDGELNFKKYDDKFFDLRRSIATLVEKTADGDFVESRDKNFVFGSPGVYGLNTNQARQKADYPSVSQLIAQILTLDPDLLDYSKKDNRVISNLGGLEIKNGYKYKSSNADRNLWERFWGVGGDLLILNNFETFLNGKFWGFYVAFIENMRIAEQSVVLFLFFAGFLIMVLQKILQGLQGFFGDNESKQNFSISKIIVGPVLTLLVFTAPLIQNNMKIPCEYIKPGGPTVKGYISLSNNANTNTPLANGVNTQCYNKQANSNTNAFDYEISGSTLIQSAIRYFVTYGQLIANDFADYGLYTYLNYLRIREGGALGETISVLGQETTQNKKDFVVLSRTYRFYSTFCKSYYNKKPYGNGHDKALSLFTTEPLAGKTALQLKRLTDSSSNKKLSQIAENTYLGWTAPTAQLCASLENTIEDITQKAFSKFAFLNQSIDIVNKKMSAEYGAYFAVNNQASSGTTVDFGTGSLSQLTTNMIEAQETVGWIFSSMVPISYTLFYSTDLSDSIAEKQKNVKKYMKSATKQQKEFEFDDEAGWLTHTVQSLFPSTMYFLLPGFNNLYLGIVKILGDFIEPIKEFIVNVVTVGSLFIPGLGWLFKILLSGFTNLITTASASVIKWVGGFYIAVILYNIFLQFISLMAITLMLVFKIAMYYIEVMIFFVASPCVVIWAVITKRADVIWHYIGRAAILTVTPLLIVLSCYIYIFATELMTSLYTILTGSLASMFVTDSTGFVQNMIVFMICGVGNAIILLVYIIIGYIIIIRFNSWFLDTVGAKASAMDNIAEDFANQTKRFYSAF